MNVETSETFLGH